MSEEHTPPGPPAARKRGFGSMDPAKQRAAAQKGARAAHASGKAHRWTAEEARAAGRKAGRKHSREHMAEIGRIGGKTRADRAAARRAEAAQAQDPTSKPPDESA